MDGRGVVGEGRGGGTLFLKKNFKKKKKEGDLERKRKYFFSPCFVGVCV